MNVTQAIEGAHRLNNWILARLDNLEFQRSDKEFLATLCFDMVIEHQAAAALLLKNNISGTAFALPRLVFDAFVRGCWLLHCATEDEIHDYKNDLHRPKFDQLIKELERQPGFTDNVLSQLKDNSWRAMNSYAHSGMLQLMRRVKSDEIAPCYDDEEKIEVLKLCGTFALMAFQQMVFLAGRTDLAEEALERLTNGGALQ